MKTRFFDESETSVVPPLIDVVMNAFAATFILLTLYMVVIRPGDPTDKCILKGQEEIKNELDSALIYSGIVDSFGSRFDGHRLIISFGEDILFGVGEYTLNRHGIQVIQAAGKVFRRYHGILYNSSTQACYFSTISIDGHTDSRPVGHVLSSHGIQNNWDLSSRRAREVLFLFKNNGIGESIMSATGYADSRPIKGNRGNPLNRRIEITLIFSPEDIERSRRH